MSLAVCFIIASLFYSISLNIIYFKKSHLKNIETKLFSVMLVLNLIGLILELSCYFLVKADSMFLANLFNRAYLIYLLAFIFLFNVYTIVLFYKMRARDNKDIDRFYKKTLKISGIIYGIIALVVICFPISFINNPDYVYSYGTGINILFCVAFLTTSLWAILSFININRIFNKKCLPIIAFIILSVITTIVQQHSPGLTLTTVMETFVIFLMFHTIENPDVQIINLLMRNKELVEQSVNEKSNFLFKISQDLKKPINDILKEIKAYKNAGEEERKQLIESIENNANTAYFIINDITDISSADVKELNIKENKYKTEKLFKDIKASVKNELSLNGKDKNIEFSFKVNSNCPETLTGDNIKVKQVLLSIINNSIKYTKKGFIDIEVDSIVRYDECRLIFTINDSGCGMSISKINKLLSEKVELSPEDFQKIDGLDLKIPVIIKILKLLGGSINIKSKEDYGTNVVIVINQKIEYDSTELVLKGANKYETSAKEKYRVLVADDTENLEKVERLLSKYDVDVIPTLIGKEVVDKIKAGDKFDLIILRDEMKPDSAYSILKKLKENKNFDVPVIIMINKDKEFIKEHFLNDGFSDCIKISQIEEEIKRICNKYM